ncbi:MAG TPA: AraC family transcriptional regulator [Planctomycetota bacterium]|nr:AraC family transcriptional regulator [Planctomycetota bacterium]
MPRKKYSSNLPSTPGRPSLPVVQPSDTPHSARPTRPLNFAFSNPDLKLYIKRYPTPSKVDIHHHVNFVEIVVVVRGQARHLWDTAEQILSAGDMFCIAPGEPHGYTDVQNFEIINCLFDPEIMQAHQPLFSATPGLMEFLVVEPLFREEIKRRRLIKLPPRRYEQAVALLDQASEFLDRGTVGALSALGLLFQFLGVAGKAWTEQTANTTDTEVAQAQNWAFAQARSHMMANLNNDLNLDALAASACLSPGHFCRVFKSTTGLSPIAYLTQLRLDRASELLTTTDKPIIDIGLACGFQDPGYFARVFKKTFAKSPREYRRGGKHQ